LQAEIPNVCYCPQLSKQDMTAIIESAVKGEEVNGDLCV